MSIVALLFTACSNQKYPGFTEKDGLIYKIIKTENDTQVARRGDVLTVRMNYRTMDDSSFSPNQSNQSFDIPMPPEENRSYKGDVYDALSILHPGDSATFIFNSDSFFVKTVGAPRPVFLDSGSTFYLDIAVDSMKTKAQVRAEAERVAQQLRAEGQQAIDNYIAANNLNVGLDDDGIYFVETKKGNGPKPKNGDYIEIDLIATALTGEQFIDTYKEGKPYNIQVGTGQLGMGFEYAIKRMTEGSKATAIIPSDLAFGGQGVQGFVPPHSPVVYQIYIRKVKTAEQYKTEQEAEQKAREAEKKKLQQEEQAKLNAYLKANNITATPTADGLIYIEEKAGDGPQATKGKKVKMHYTGYLLNGKKFDSSHDRGQPLEFTVGEGQMIKGIDEGVMMMRQGGKARLILPSNIAYGGQETPYIPPYSTLIFDVELIEVSE